MNDADESSSDTGERDVPDPQDFQLNRPVDKAIRVGHKRVLNRAGRAVCRIVAAHGWEPADIARIFGEPVNCVRPAIDNETSPTRRRDNVFNDYDFAPPGYRLAFPPTNQSESVSAPVSASSTPSFAAHIPSAMRSASAPISGMLSKPKAVSFDADALSRSASPLPSTSSTPTPTNSTFSSDSFPFPAPRGQKRTLFDAFKRPPPPPAMLDRLKLQLSLDLPTSHPMAIQAALDVARHPRRKPQTVISIPASESAQWLAACSVDEDAESMRSTKPPSASQLRNQSVPLIRRPLPLRKRLATDQLEPVAAAAAAAAPIPVPNSDPRSSLSSEPPITKPTPPPIPPISKPAPLPIPRRPVPGVTPAVHAPNPKPSAPPPQHYLISKGLTPARARILARWPADERREALARLLEDISLANVHVTVVVTLDAVERELVELVKQDDLWHPPAINAPQPLNPAHPDPFRAYLATCCESAYGIDLSGHADLLLRRGFTLERLRGLQAVGRANTSGASGGWNRKQTRDFVWGALGPGSDASADQGPTPFELLALEFALRPP